MKFVVCIKQVPDVSAPFRIRDSELVFDTDRTVLNAYDASAVEAALVLREMHEGTIDEIEVLTVGPDAVKETVRKALAMGADRGVHLVAEDDADYDAWSYANLLARHLETADYDVIACGKQSQDTDAGLTGSMLAALLDLPYATNAVGLELEPGRGTLVVERQGDQGTEFIELPTPCLVTCSNDMNNPRIPKLKGIMQAKRKPIDTRPVSELADTVEAKTERLAYEPIPEREPGEILEGEPEEQVREVIERLHEANVL